MGPLQGAKGAAAPQEAADTLKSVQRAEVVDLLGEGQIGGLVNGLKSVYLDGVPVENADGSRNFPEFGLKLTLGGPTSEAEHGFGDVQTEVSVGVTVLAAVPVVRTITDDTADSVRVTITVPQLVQVQENGDRTGAEFEWAVDIQSNGGGFVERWTDTVSGKASATYSRAVVLSLREVGPPPWDVRVRRVTADSTSGDLVNAFAWASYTLIAGVKMLYRHSAVAELTVSARNFSAIFQRWYDVMGISDWDIPVNYDPLARTVSGSWNGLWKQGWTNNPAWVLYNLIKHPRYGLGEYVTQLPDKWTLYQLALWADEPLSDGRGGTEPRYSVNVAIVEQSEALRLLQEICAVFRGVLMHGGSTLTLTWDAPGEPVASYAPANVVDGLFTYADGSAAAKKTSCTCWYTDRTQAAKRVPVTWDDPELVARYGLRTMEIKPIGVSTPGQALRMAKWALYTAHYEEQTVTFRVGAEGPVRRLGEVFQITDPSETGERLGGRIAAATLSTLQLDAPVTLAAGETYTVWVTQPHATDPGRLVLESRTVTTAAGTVQALTVTPAFSAVPVVQTVWLLEGTDVVPTLWRYVAISEVKGDDGQPTYEVMGVRHEPGKWALIEADQPLTPRPTRRLASVVPPVASITITESVWYDAESKAHSRVTVAWPAPAAGLRYVLGYRVRRGNWEYLPPTSATEREFEDVQPGTYDVQVQAMDALGRMSVPTYATATILGDATPVPDPTGLDWAIKPGQVWAWWDKPVPATLQSELRVGADWATATVLWSGVSTDYKHPRPENGTYRLWLAHVRGTLESENPIYVDVVVDDSIDPAAGAGTLKLTTDRFPFFSFSSGTSHTAVPPGDGLLTITANLVNLYGTATFVAEAFDARIGGASLGFITLGGTGNARTISAAQFVSLGTSGSVRRIHVTANIGAANDEIDIYRQDSTTTAPILYLSNPTHAVPTDESGEYGDYSGAETEAAVYEGLTDTTDDWTWSITADSGVTAAINGGAGPVANPTSVLVAVSAMTVPTGAVLVEADDGVDTLSASFVVDKIEASGSGYQVVWSPRSEIRLPVTAAGDVASYDDAWSEYRIIKGGKLDDTPNWMPSKTDINVTSTLTSNRVDVTALVSLGTVGTIASEFFDYGGAGWEWVGGALYGDGTYLALGRNNSSTWNYVIRSTDYAVWELVDVGLAGKWSAGALDAGAWVLIELSVGSTNKTRRSTDGGQTWSGAVTLPAPSQWYDIAAGNGKMLITSQISTTGCESTDGGATWSSRSFPATSLFLWPGPANLWLSRDASDVVRLSLDNAVTWVTVSALPEVAWMGKPFAGRLVVTLRAVTNKAAYYEIGVGWVVVTLPQSIQNGELVHIGTVLYMVGSGKLLYTTDGKAWQYAGAATMPAGGPITKQFGSLQTGFVPMADGGAGQYRTVELLATSASEGAVRMRFTKPGELPMESVLPVLKGQPAADVYAFGAFPGYLELPATSDGVVTDWSQARITLEAFKNAQPDTSNWTWTWTATNMTPSSGTGNVVTFTAMSADTGQLFPRASKPGQPDLVPGGINIFKRKGAAGSGPIVGGAFHVTEVVQTYVALRFKGNGMVQVKRGASGSWEDYVPWAGAIRSENSAKYLRVDATGHALDSGTTGIFLALTTDRDYVLIDATSGTHLTSLSVLIADDSAGTNAINGFGSLKLIVL